MCSEAATLGSGPCLIQSEFTSGLTIWHSQRKRTSDTVRFIQVGLKD